MPFGTLTTLDSLGASATQTIAQFGEDRTWDVVNAHLVAHNAIMQDMIETLCEQAPDQLRRYGGEDTAEMEELDQMGIPDAQKVTAGSNVGFPLRQYGAALQWTRKALRVMTLGEMDAAVTAIFGADRRAVQREIKRALMRSTNYTFTDRLVNNLDLPVKRLVNADSAPIPLGPNGETFVAASHTHYLATASFVVANLDSLIDTVREHFGIGTVRVYINKAQEATVKGFTGFVAYVDPRLINQSTTTVARSSLSLPNSGDRAIGLYREAEIWVKPWVPASYLYGYVDGAPKPLVFRRREGSGDLELVFEDESYPLRAKGYEREFGVGVWTRTNGAMLYTGGGSYTNPTLN